MTPPQPPEGNPEDDEEAAAREGRGGLEKPIREVVSGLEAGNDDLEEDLEEALGIVSHLAPDAQKEVAKLMAFGLHMERHSWYPHPDELDRLKDYYPEIYLEIHTGPREVRETQIAIQIAESTADIEIAKWGQRFGFVVALLVALGSAVALVKGNAVGVAGVVVGLGGLGTAFIPNRNRRVKHLPSVSP
jgi:hypothetical protein